MGIALRATDVSQIFVIPCHLKREAAIQYLDRTSVSALRPAR
jgi:hypothetical protein